MRTLAIGDIHGCSTALENLWDFAGITRSDRVVFLGDYVDRGPKSKDVIDFIISRKSEGKVICLRGNHEAVMLEALVDRSVMQRWCSPTYGGEATLDSYHARSFSDIPEAHWEFLKETRRTFETDSHIFVHANLDPDRPVKDQTDLTLMWSFFDHAKPHQSGKVMIWGHSSQESGLPKDLGFAVCIDTHACGGGWLSCLDVESREYWQTSEDGKRRRGELKE